MILQKFFTPKRALGIPTYEKPKAADTVEVKSVSMESSTPAGGAGGNVPPTLAYLRMGAVSVCIQRSRCGCLWEWSAIYRAGKDSICKSGVHVEREIAVSDARKAAIACVLEGSAA